MWLWQCRCVDLNKVNHTLPLLFVGLSFPRTLARYLQHMTTICRLSDDFDLPTTTTQPQLEGWGLPCRCLVTVAASIMHQRWKIYTSAMVDLRSSDSSTVSLFKGFWKGHRFVSNFHGFVFFLTCSWITYWRIFYFVEESLISLKNFILIILRKERESIDLFYFFYWVD